MKKILIIVNDKNQQKALRSLLNQYRISPSYSGKSGLALSQSLCPDLILLDIDLPDINGLEVLKQIQEQTYAPPVILFTSFCHPQNIVNAMLEGAVDFIPKYCSSKDLIKSITRVLPPTEINIKQQQNNTPTFLDKLIGETNEIIAIKNKIFSLKDLNIPVLITGETGTGKELVAKLLHQAYQLGNGPFKVLHSNSIPATLIESELFGTEIGAFTGARNKIGLFEQAHNGTLFIDEIGDMPITTQIKILRALENKEITPLGSSKTNYISVRIISATNRVLSNLIKVKCFRLDLFFRICGFQIDIPPLRERKEDIPLLVNAFMNDNKHIGKRKSISSQAIEKLQNHHWPGNVRELQHTITNALISTNTNNSIQAKHINFYKLD